MWELNDLAAFPLLASEEEMDGVLRQRGSPVNHQPAGAAGAKIHPGKLQSNIIADAFNRLALDLITIAVDLVGVTGGDLHEGPLRFGKRKPLDMHLLTRDKTERSKATQTFWQQVCLGLIMIVLGLLLVDYIRQ